MKINVRNYSNLEIVNNSIVVLKGDIDSQENIIVTDLEVWLGHDCKKSLVIINNCFSVILKLFKGNNLIFFKNRDKVINTLELIFKDKDTSDASYSFNVKPLIILSKSDTDHVSNTCLYSNKIHIGLELLQWFFSEKLLESGFPRSSFNLIDCSSFTLSLSPSDIHEMDINKLWETLAREIMEDRELWNEKWKYVAFVLHPWKEEVNSTDEIYAVSPKSVLGGGGLLVVDYTLLEIWPDTWENIFMVLNDNSETPRNRISAYFNSIGRQYGTALGIVAHEMGHVFDLGHSKDGLMGNGFHRFALTLQPKIKSILGIKTKKVYFNSECILEDPVQLPLSCVTLLHYNRWFNSRYTRSLPSEQDIRISVSNYRVTSPFGISVVEVRQSETGLILSSWTTDKTEVKTTFLLSKQFVEEIYQNQDVELVVQDTSGAVLKTPFNFSNAPLPRNVTCIKRVN